MTTHKILISDKLGIEGTELALSAEDVDVVVSTDLSRTELLDAVADVHAIIVRSATQLDAEVIAAASKLRIIGRAGVGVDNIDLDEATRRGVMVTNTPHANSVATAEQAMTLMLGAARHLPQAHASLSAGRWDRSQYVGVELQGRTLGIIGFGRIGRAVAVRAKAFGMEVVAYDPFVSELVGRDLGVSLAELETVLAAADVVTLHAIPPADGSAILDARAISLMKPGSIIVNAARGQLLDASAARDALDSGLLRAVAVDVYAEEPPAKDHPLIGHPQVVHTPHLGASTDEAQRDVSLQVVDQVMAALRGDRLEHCVNVPFIFDAETEIQLELATAMGRLQAIMAPAAVDRVEVEVADSEGDELATVAAGFLAGLLAEGSATNVNFVNAPALADERGITVSQGRGIGRLDYPNLVSCRVSWPGGGRTMSGVVFGGKSPRIVQISDYHLDASPQGIVLVMLSSDLPGVIGQVGTLLGTYDVNIAEWRLGRDNAGGQALSFVNLDSFPSQAAVDAVRQVPAVEKAEVLEL